MKGTRSRSSGSPPSATLWRQIMTDLWCLQVPGCSPAEKGGPAVLRGEIEPSCRPYKLTLERRHCQGPIRTVVGLLLDNARGSWTSAIELPVRGATRSRQNRHRPFPQRPSLHSAEALHPSPGGELAQMHVFMGRQHEHEAVTQRRQKAADRFQRRGF